MNEITKELLDALKGSIANAEQEAFESWLADKSPSGDAAQVKRQWEESSDRHDFLSQRKMELAVIAKAEAILAATQSSDDTVEAAFREGFRSPTTYNDTVMNNEDDAWENSEARAKATLAATQPSYDDWIPWKGGECPVERRVVVMVRGKNGEVDSDKAHFYDWHHTGSSIDIIAYRAVKP